MTQGARFGALLLAAVLAAIGAGVGSVLASNVLAERNRRATDRAVCTLVARGAATERDKLQAYDLEPPKTQAGKAQREQTRQALDGYIDDARSLGCPIERK